MPNISIFACPYIEFEGDISKFNKICTYEDCMEFATQAIQLVATDNAQRVMMPYYVCLDHTMNVLAMIAGLYRVGNTPPDEGLLNGSIREQG